MLLASFVEDSAPRAFFGEPEERARSDSSETTDRTLATSEFTDLGTTRGFSVGKQIAMTAMPASSILQYRIFVIVTISRNQPMAQFGIEGICRQKTSVLVVYPPMANWIWSTMRAVEAARDLS